MGKSPKIEWRNENLKISDEFDIAVRNSSSKSWEFPETREKGILVSVLVQDG